MRDQRGGRGGGGGRADRAGWVRRQLGGGAAGATDAPDAPDAPSENAGAPAPPLQTFLPAGAELEGTLRLRHSFRIDTELRGAIVCDATVIVGEDAGIEASIRAREVEIRGAVVGDVVASRLVTVRAGARLHGDIETPCIEIERGAFVNGRTKMVRPQAVARARAAPDRPAADPARARSAPEARSEPSGPAAARPPS